MSSDKGLIKSNCALGGSKSISAGTGGAIAPGMKKDFKKGKDSFSSNTSVPKAGKVSGGPTLK